MKKIVIKKSLISLLYIALVLGCSAPDTMSLHFPSKQGDLSTVKDAIEIKKIPIDSLDIGDGTPLMWASDINVIKYLVEKGANINATDSNNVSVLMTKADNYEALQYLLENGIRDINVKDSEGETVLFYAYRYNADQKIIDLLLKYGANDQIKDKKNKTALQKYPHKEKINIPIGTLKYSMSNQHFEVNKKAHQKQENFVNTEFYIQNTQTNEITKFSNSYGSFNIAPGIYRFYGLGAYISVPTEKIHDKYFNVGVENLFLKELPDDDFNKLTFTISQDKVACININSKTKFWVNHASYLDIYMMGYSNFEVNYSCDLQNNKINEKHLNFQFGFDKFINFDYIKFIDAENTKLYYISGTPSVELTHFNSEANNGNRIIPNLNSKLSDELVKELNTKHLIEQKYFFEKYLLEMPKEYIK